MSSLSLWYHLAYISTLQGKSQAYGYMLSHMLAFMYACLIFLSD